MRSQLGLFGGGKPLFPSKDVQQMRVDALVPNISFGTSSWTFDGWRDFFYHRHYVNQRVFVAESLAEYCLNPLMKVVGVDRSFYLPPTGEEWAAMKNMLQPETKVVSKVWSEVSTRIFPNHARYGKRAGALNPHFLDPEIFMKRVALPVEENLGRSHRAYLMQISPSPGGINHAGFLRRVDHFLSQIPASLRLVFEVRDWRLATGEYYSLLREHRCGSVLNIVGEAPRLAEQIQRVGEHFSGYTLIRWLAPRNADYAALKARFLPFTHLVEPSEEVRTEVIMAAKKRLNIGDDVAIIVSNKSEGSAPWSLWELSDAFCRE